MLSGSPTELRIGYVVMFLTSATSTDGSPTELRIGCMVMFLTSYGMNQDQHKNTSKHGVQNSTSSMGLLQKKS